ncbi:MAG: DUF4834 family protein [Bacteroidales bacterium]|nr:DUF4834 family protein [Bacteroidales bacterium]
MFIFHLLFMFIIFMVLLALVGSIALRGLLRRLFGGGTPWGGRKQQGGMGQQQSPSQRTAPQKPKIINKDEGEYVDYEEVR